MTNVINHEDNFKQAIFNDLKIADNPKRESLYNIAKKFSDGSMADIYDKAHDLAELII